jgi:hypothetical protein
MRWRDASALRASPPGRRAVCSPASPLAFTVLYWAAGIQELASGVAVLAAAWVMTRTDRWQWAAVPLFAVAMLCKESVIAAPIALAFIYGRRTRPVAAAMLVIGVAIFLGSGLQHRMMNSSLDSPYATAYDKTLFDNLATQLVWFLAPWRSYPDRIAGPNAHFLIYLIGFTGALVGLAFIDRRTPAADSVGECLVRGAAAARPAAAPAQLRLLLVPAADGLSDLGRCRARDPGTDVSSRIRSRRASPALRSSPPAWSALPATPVCTRR